MTTPRTVSEMYPTPWLHCDDLRDRTHTVTIHSVSFDSFFNPRTNEEQLKAYVSFAEAEKMLILNKTQSFAIADIAGTERYSQWPGTRITLAPGRTNAGAPTIVIKPAEAPKPKQAPRQAKEGADAPAVSPNGADPETVETIEDVNADLFGE